MKETPVQQVVRFTKSALKFDGRRQNARVLPERGQKSANVEVFSQTIPRALQVLDLFLNACGSIGAKFDFSEHFCEINYRGYRCPFRIREITKRGKKNRPRDYEQVPTGRLELSLKWGYPEPKFSDTSTFKLERQIPQIIETLPKLALEMAKRKLRLARQKRKSEQEERLQEIEEERLELASENTRKLVTAATRFQKGQRIHRFLDSIEARIKEDAGKHWLTAARQYADSLQSNMNGKEPWKDYHNLFAEAGGLFVGQEEVTYENGHTEMAPKIIPVEFARKTG